MGLMDRDYWKDRHRTGAPNPRIRQQIAQLQEGLDRREKRPMSRMTAAVLWGIVIVGLYCLVAVFRR